MGRFLALSLALIVGAWIAMVDQRLPASRPVDAPAIEFAGERAFSDVKLLSARPHPHGSAANAAVRDAIVARMQSLGLSPQVRTGVGVQPFREAPDNVSAGVVENIVGVLPGRDRSLPAVALMAHYDSVPASPGAADDLLGVASALEIARAIKARGTPQHDVMLVITDGEETGLLGANHFFRRDPLARRIGLLFNMEARGSSGRVSMFQTSPQNGGLVRLFRETARRPASSSLLVLVYEKLPNDTDLTEALRAGIPGLNYAIIGNLFDYHSPTSTAATLDRGSLQDMGTQVLAAAGNAAFDYDLPTTAPPVVYSKLFADTVLAYPPWFGWAILATCAGLLALAIRRARLSGAFPAGDILRGAGAQLFAALGAVAVLEFARRFTGAGPGFFEQRFVLAQAPRWEWAAMLISTGFLLFSAGALARGRRWIALTPLAPGLGASAFGGLDAIGVFAGVVASLVGLLIYGRPSSREGAWAGGLALTLLIAAVVQAMAPGAAFVFAWPLLVACLGAAATALCARGGTFALLLLAALAAPTLGWIGSLAHFSFDAMDLMPLFAVPILTAAAVLWPLAQPEAKTKTGLWAGTALLLAGFAITLVVRADEPWGPRHPQASYVGYHLDQDTGKAWRFSVASIRSRWGDAVLQADGGRIAPYAHWAWREKLVAAPARPVQGLQPSMRLAKQSDGTLLFHADGTPDARLLDLELRTDTPTRISGLAGVPVDMAMAPKRWVKIRWRTAARGLDLWLRPAGSGRLDVRYRRSADSWPAGASALPPRPADVMPWDNSDSTFVTGTKAFAW